MTVTRSMKGTYHICVLLFSLLFIPSSQSSLDVSDYTFYFNTYHYALSPLSTKSTTIYNEHLNLNLSIEFNDTMFVIINNKHTLNILSDTQWNEISTVSRISSQPSQQQSSRSLLQYHEYSHYFGTKPYDGLAKNAIKHGHKYQATQLQRRQARKRRRYRKRMRRERRRRQKWEKFKEYWRRYSTSDHITI